MIGATGTGNDGGRLGPPSRLREMPRDVEAADMRAFTWDDIDLEHGCHEQRGLVANDRMLFTTSNAAGTVVVRRFSELNYRRYEEEQRAAHATKPRASKGTKAVPGSQGAHALFDAPKAEPNTATTKAAAPAKKAGTRRPR